MLCLGTGKHGAGRLHILEKLTDTIETPRPDVKRAVELTHQAGVRTIVLTGDHGLTAAAIAKDIGITSENKPYQVIISWKISLS